MLSLHCNQSDFELCHGWTANGTSNNWFWGKMTGLPEKLRASYFSVFIISGFSKSNKTLWDGAAFKVEDYKTTMIKNCLPESLKSSKMEWFSSKTTLVIITNELYWNSAVKRRQERSNTKQMYSTAAFTWRKNPIFQIIQIFYNKR